MQVRVLGKSPAWQDRGGACSGYLVQVDGFTVLLDCGSGVFGKLRAATDYATVDAVVISHLHPDHTLDLVPYSFALGHSPRFAGKPPRPPLHAPPGAVARFRQLGAVVSHASQIEEMFDLREYDPAAPLSVGPLTLRFCEVPHYIQSFAIEFTGPGGTRFTFGADCAPSDALAEFANGTDLLMLEATLAQPDTSDFQGHMTGAEAGDLGRRAHARRLVVTHFSDELDAEWVRSEAARGFGREVTLALEGAELSV